MGHESPNAEWFEKGIIALDAPLAAAAKSGLNNVARSEERGLPGAALVIYGRAVVHGAQQEFAAEANTKYEALRKQFDDEVAGVEDLLRSGDASAAATGWPSCAAAGASVLKRMRYVWKAHLWPVP